MEKVQIGDATLYLGDCREVLPRLGQIDAVVTDPPYGVGYKFGCDNVDEPKNWEKQIAGVWETLQSVTGGPICWFGSSSRLSRDLQIFPATPDRIIVWTPRFTLSMTRANGLKYKWHPIYCWQIEGWSPDFDRDWLDEPCEGNHWWNHPATKPLSLMRRLVTIVQESSVIVDPFMGSGTTGVACHQLGRCFIGIETNREYFDIACKRIDESHRQPHLFDRVSPKIEQLAMDITP